VDTRVSVDEAGTRAVLAAAFSHGPGKTVPLPAPARPGHRRAGTGVPLAALAAGGPFGAALMRVLRLALAPQRFEPWNAYNDHRAYPSPRAAFVVDVDVLAGADRWHLDPVRDRLFGPGEPPPLPSTARLELTPDPDRLPSTYRSLAEALAYLELGHVAAALVEAAAAQGLAATYSTVDGRAMVTLASDTPRSGAASPAGHDPAPRSGAASPPGRDPAGPGPAMWRSAGIAPCGLTADPRPLPAVTLPTLLRAGTEPPPGSPAHRPGLRHAVAARAVTGHPDGIYRAGPILAVAGDVMPDVQKAFTYPPRSIATAGMNLAWVMSAAVADTVRADGPAAYHELLVAAGAAAQHVGTAAAGLGLFCRPCRSVREAPLEALVGAPAGHDFLYLLLVGRSRVRDFGYDLTRP
jgi:hypothetical protein